MSDGVVTAQQNQPPSQVGDGLSELDYGETLVFTKALLTTTLKIYSLSVYVDDASAGAGGLTTGDIYITSTGELRGKL